MKTFFVLLSLTALLSIPSPAQEAPPEKAMKYHEALLRRPDNATLFDRFFGAWLDEQPIESLSEFLTARAEKNGGQDLAILARYQLRRGQEEEALDTLGKAITALPEQFSLPLERSKILLRRLEFEAARKDLAIVAGSPDEALALEASKLTGKSWLREGKPEEAIKAWDALLAAHPGDEDLLEDLVESAATEGEFDQALAYVDKLIASSSDPYKKTLRQLRRGDLLAQSGKSDEAVEAYSATLANVGEGSWLEREVLAQIEKTFRKQDRLDDLTAKLLELAEANPRRLLIHRQLAKIEAAQGETDAAVGRFREVLKRSPGDRELREEFVRLLTDGEKFKEAAEELEKLIALAPDDAGLMLQMADLRNREKNPEAVLAALEKARALLGEDETSGIRIAGLMFQYDLNQAGEKLLSDLASRENASVAPSEALAAEYARTKRKDEALALLKKIAVSENLDTVLRAAASISALSEPETALEILSAKTDDFGNEPRFLATITQAALAADKAEIATRHAVKLVRIANPATDLAESIGLALRAITAADKSIEWRKTLEKQDARSPAETCLLAALADSHSDFEAVSEIMAGASDPTVIRFHAALLDRRGEFEKAIAVLSGLADTDEGRKTSYFKDMTDLQRRAGLSEDALATIELWKQSAPGDKAAWIIEGSILREEGRPDEAVKVARQAVARFGDDTDLAAILASLYEEAGQTQDADAIYWRLYDEAGSPSDQSRWAVSLAKLANSTGRTEELEEKLRERSRSNRRSIGPILALAELARITQDEEKRRDLLLEAVRLQPNDIDLRLQIANLEEQSGNPDRVLAILEEAVAVDSSNRVRSALAQAYLRQGQTMKGMRELRAMAGKQADDPRAIEQSAATLAGSGLYEEAIRFLREVLPDGGDWRTKYLLAIMLEHDGRETEAIPLFQTLRQATGDIEGVQPATQNSYARLQDYDPEVREIMSLITAGQSAYAHRDANNSHRMGGFYGQSGGRVGPFVLPDSAESVRTFALVHLAQLDAAGVENGDFIREIASSGRGNQRDYPALLVKYPEQPGLFELVLMSAGWNSQSPGLDPDFLRKLLSEKGDLSPIDRFRADMILATSPKATDEDWKNLVSSVEKAASAENKGNQNLLQIGFNLLRLLSTKDASVPENIHESLSKSLLKVASMEELDEGPFVGFRLIAANIAGTTEHWIEAANAEVKDFRNEDQQGKQPSMAARMRVRFSGNNPWGNGMPFAVPTMETVEFSSLPGVLVGMLNLPGQNNYYSYGFGDNRIDPNDLLKHLDSFDSLLLRAFIAMRAGDETAIEKTLGESFPENETADAKTLRALRALEKKDYPEAYRLLSETRPALSSDRTRLASLNFSLIAIAAEMDQEERAEISGELRALLLQARRIMGTQGAEMLAAQAKSLGFPDLAKRFVPVINRNAGAQTAMRAARIGNNSGSRSSSGGSATVAKMKKFAASGKHEAAALEALQVIRNTNSSPYGRTYAMREVTEAITPEVTEELFRLIDPGDSDSLTKLMEYADICLIFGKEKDALVILNRLNGERPEDPEVSGKLAFLLPEDQLERAMELITNASSEARFAETASTFATNFSENEDPEPILNFFSTVASWLEKTSPEKPKDTNLTWVSYHGKSFFERTRSQVLVGLGGKAPDNVRNKEEYKRYVEIAERLALAMTRHGSIAEEGFRLLRFSAAWELPDERLDALARDVLMAVSIENGPNLNSRSFFSLRLGNGSSSSGGDLSEHSSAAWLTDRLKTAENAEKILPPDFLAALREKNPPMGRLVTALADLSEIKELEELWKSGALEKNRSLHSEMLTEALLARASTIPGASAFFLERVRELKPGWIRQRGMPGSESSIQLVIAALKASSSAKQEELEAICSAIADSIYGKDFEFQSGGNDTATYQTINSFESIFQNSKLDPAETARVHGTFFRLGIPVVSNDYYIFESFRNTRFQTVQDAEKFLASCGWLEDARTWQAFAAVIVEADHSGGRISLTRKNTFLLPQVFSYANYNFSRSELTEYLEKREPRTFGALICAASMTSGKERTRLTELAFATAAPKLKDLPPERLRHFSTVLPWLPEKAFAKLPPAFRKEAEDANAERLVELRKTADNFLKSGANNNNSGRNPLDRAEQIVEELAPLDLEKAVAVFLEAERRFTDSLTRGGRLFSYTNGGLQITERDEALEDLLRTSDTPLGANIPLALKFHAAIVASPEATRFSFSKSSNALPSLSEIGERIYRSPTKKANDKNPSWLLAMREIEKMPEEVRDDAYVALACHLVANWGISRNVKLQPDREDLAKRSDLPEKMKTVRSLTLGISGWKQDDADGRSSTAEAFAAFAGNADTAPLVRFQLVSIALTMMPQMLDNSLVAETFTSMYETYSKGERSIINTLGLHGPRSVSMLTPTAENKPYLVRINEAFWKNTNSPKKGGHPVIPSEAGDYLFLSAVAAGDEANAKKLLASVRSQLEGRLNVISFLIANGNHEMAKQILAPKGGHYKRDDKKPSVPYDKAFEQQMAEFRKTPGLDPLALLRLEAQFKSDGPFVSGSDKPTETETEREQRLAEAYRKNSPTLLQDRVEVLSALTRDSHTGAIALRDEIIALRDEMDLGEVLEDWNRGSSDDKDLAKRYFFAPAKSVIFRQAAFLEFLEGDLSGLDDLVEVIGKEPAYRKRFKGRGNPGYLQSYLSRVLESAPIWICEAVHRGKTDGFRNGFDVFRKIFLLTQNRSELKINEMYQSLAVAEYLAYWSGEGEKFKDMKDDVKREKKRLDYFNQPLGIFRMAYNANNHLTWRHESFANARAGFLRHSFTRKQMEDFYPHDHNWLLNSGNRYGLRDDLLEIAANPPKDILPTVLPHLLNYRARQEFKEDQLENAVRTTLAAIDACPDDGRWKNTRFNWRYALVENLLKAGELEQAKQAYGDITLKDLNENQTKRHKELGAKIENASKK